MTSAWGAAWGAAWGDAWGIIGVSVSSYQTILTEPFEHQVGTDATHNIPLWDGPSPLNVTGITALFKLYRGVPRRGRKPWKGRVLLTKDSEDGDITLTEGNAAVDIADTDLEDHAGPYWFFLDLLNPATGAVIHRTEGELFLKALLI